MENFLNPSLPTGNPIDAWRRVRSEMENLKISSKKNYKIIVVGTGLAGSAAAATLAEKGFNVKVLTFHESPRRAHSVAAQGGINAAKPLDVDEESVTRLFEDTLRGGDFRAREFGCQRLAEISSSVINQCVAQGVPFAREYDGHLAKRKFGGALVNRTYYARGQTGQQLLYGGYQALMRQVNSKNIDLLTKRDVLELITKNGIAKGVVCRNLLSGKLEIHTANAIIFATGGYSNIYFLSTNALKSNSNAIWRAYLKGAFFANPCFTQIHPTCIPNGDHFQSKLTLMSESLRNDGRIWVPKKVSDKREPNLIKESERDYFLERQYPTYGNMVPRDVASRRARELCKSGYGVGFDGKSVYLDLSDAVNSQGEEKIKSKYGNLLEIYERIVGEDPLKSPMRIYPAPHYTMGGLWVDYNLMSSIPGLFVIGEANFSEHGANRLGANALLQALSDGYFICPSTVTSWLANNATDRISNDSQECKSALNQVENRLKKALKIKGKKPVDFFHRKLGSLMIDVCGISRTEKDLKIGLQKLSEIIEDFYTNVKIPAGLDGPNPELDKFLRLEDFFELAKLMLTDALERNESCGAHFREEHQTPEGEALRNDKEFSKIFAWEFVEGDKPKLHKENLEFQLLKPKERSYK